MSAIGRKVQIALVVKHAMQKTCIVSVDRVFRHPRYHKTIRRTTTFAVHDPKDETKAGDRIRIRETRPISKRKRWELVEIVERNGEV